MIIHTPSILHALSFRFVSSEGIAVRTIRRVLASTQAEAQVNGRPVFQCNLCETKYGPKTGWWNVHIGYSLSQGDEVYIVIRYLEKFDFPRDIQIQTRLWIDTFTPVAGTPPRVF